MTWSLPTDCPLAHIMAERLRADRNELTTRWLTRIAARVTIDANQIFPTDDLLDHVPLLIIGVADYIEDPREEVGTDMPVVAEARELGALRHAQGFDAYEILKEFEILGGVIFTYLTQIVEAIDEPCTRGELLQCMHRLFRAIEVIQQATTAHFLELSATRTREREDRLRGFNRLVSHELKNTVHTIVGAHAMLQESVVASEAHNRFIDIIGRNANALQKTLTNLLDLSRLDSDIRQHKNVLFSRATSEAVRQVREAAQSANVAILLREPFPAIEVNAAAIELCLTNYLSNAVKYTDPMVSDRWVEVVARIDQDSAHRTASSIATHAATTPSTPPDTTENTQPHTSLFDTLVIEVRDNGLGIPPAARQHLFERFFRAHTANDIPGTGLGLSLVRETIEALGGTVWAAPNHPSGSIFGIALPSRRANDINIHTP